MSIIGADQIDGETLDTIEREEYTKKDRPTGPTPPQMGDTKDGSITKLTMIGISPKSSVSHISVRNHTNICNQIQDGLDLFPLAASLYHLHGTEYHFDSVLMGLPTFNFLPQLSDDLKELVDGQPFIDGHPRFNKASCLIVDMASWYVFNSYNFVNKHSSCEIFHYPPDDTRDLEANPLYMGLTRQRVYPSDMVSSTICSVLSLLEVQLPPHIVRAFRISLLT